MRDIEAAYKDALLEEHASYVRAGREAEAEHVAGVLKGQYGHDVAKKSNEDGGEKEKKPEPAPERADAEKAPEAAVEPKPRRTTRTKPADGGKSA